MTFWQPTSGSFSSIANRFGILKPMIANDMCTIKFELYKGSH